MFAKHYLHLITSLGLSVWERQGTQLKCIARFVENDQLAGTEAFAQWLAKHPRAVHRILLDLPDEGFQVEQIPPVSGSDRKTLIKRRQLQQFLGTPYSTAFSLGRLGEGRRDERILLVALTRPAALEPWLECLRTTQARLAGVFSSALLTRQLLSSIQPDNPQGLILSLSPAGIRQTYFEQGMLRFSRLTPPPDGLASDWGQTCLHEAQKTAQYLTAQRWITRNTPLPVWLLAQREDFASLVGVQQGIDQINNQLEFRLASLDAIAHQAGMRQPFEGSDSSALMVHLALREKGPQLAPEADRRFFHIWRIRTAIALLGLGASLILCLMALANHRETQALAEQDRALREAMQLDGRRYDQLLASLPRLPTTLETLQGVVQAQARLNTDKHQPIRALKQIAQALAPYPDITLQALNWQPNSGGRNKQAEPTMPQSMVYTLDASLAENQLDARAVIARIQSFADELKRQTHAEVIGLKTPYESESTKTLSSDAIQHQGRLLFQIQLKMPEAQP
ncbi:hypothetical protein [Uliginosibacterium gangwonense]|uniref:hypothetical protein n=1 Tax=Uliginosibacterium gangwonense TaxID=392736 RepID=UPI00035D27CD|nr:hypothetical protein [Uliginosibacterium gangwonense]